MLKRGRPGKGAGSVRDVMTVLLAQTATVVGGDVVELNPTRDINGVTAVLAAKMVKDLAALATRG